MLLLSSTITSISVSSVKQYLLTNNGKIITTSTCYLKTSINNGTIIPTIYYNIYLYLYITTSIYLFIMHRLYLLVHATTTLLSLHHMVNLMLTNNNITI